MLKGTQVATGGTSANGRLLNEQNVRAAIGEHRRCSAADDSAADDHDVDAGWNIEDAVVHAWEHTRRVVPSGT
jgi:hypothetical protein